jgi:hypothetical protein
MQVAHRVDHRGALPHFAPCGSERLSGPQDGGIGTGKGSGVEGVGLGQPQPPPLTLSSSAAVNSRFVSVVIAESPSRSELTPQSVAVPVLRSMIVDVNNFLLTKSVAHALIAGTAQLVSGALRTGIVMNIPFASRGACKGVTGSTRRKCASRRSSGRTPAFRAVRGAPMVRAVTCRRKGRESGQAGKAQASRELVLLAGSRSRR